MLDCHATGRDLSQPIRIPTPTDPSSIAAGDLNGDWIADIVWIDLYNSHGTVKVFLSQLGGGYLPGPDVVSGSSTVRPGVCVMTDVNHDSHLDLVCRAGSQRKLISGCFWVTAMEPSTRL